MGQYHLVVNLDKREFLHPHHLGDGLKLMEFGNDAGGVMTALAILLAISNGRGGGDLHIPNGHVHADLIGSWGGDRIAIVGDYAEDSDLQAPYRADLIWDQCLGDKPSYKDLSAKMRTLIEADGIYTFEPTSYGFTRKARP